MGLDAIIRSALATAKSITADLQADVEHEAFVSIDAYNKATYDTAVTRKAVVEFKPRMVRNAAGEEVLSKANMMFVEPVSVDLRDRFTLPDGTVAPILATSTVVDPSTNAGYYLQIFF